MLTVYRWILIGMVVQFSILLMVDRVFLSNNVKVTTSAFKNSVQIQKDIPDRGILVDRNAEWINFSFDLQFFAYMQNNAITIQDTKNNSLVSLIENEEGKISYFRWMSDRNMLIYASTYTNQNSSNVEITTVDLENDQQKKYPLIRGLGKSAEIKSIEVSPLTKVLYAQVIHAQNEQIYAFDIMNNLTFIRTVPLGTKILETQFYDSLLLDDQDGNFQIYDGQTKRMRKPFANENLVLLSLGNEDKAYLGKLNDDYLVEKIYHVKIESAKAEITHEQVLNNPAEPSQIVVMKNGRIFIHQLEGKRLLEIDGEAEETYQGRIIEVREDLIITRLEDRLMMLKI